MKSLFFSIFLMVFILIPAVFASEAHAATASLSWSANDPAENVVDYKLYIGTASRTYGDPIQVGNAISKAITLEVVCGKPMTFYFVVTAINMAGLESVYSAEVSKDFLAPPCAPRNLTITITLGVNLTPNGMEFALQGPAETKIN